MEAARGGGGGSRDFMAFFVIDQRHPLPTPRTLPPLSERLEACGTLLTQQLQPRGTFGFDSSDVYSTGNGSVADVGWVRHAGTDTGIHRDYPDAASLIGRLNLQPPRVERGISMLLDGPRPAPEEAVSFNAASGWAEAWIGEGERACFVYVDLTYGEALREQPPEEGVSEVRSFTSMVEFAAFVESEGFWTDDARLQARLEGRAIELVVGGVSSWVRRAQLQPVRRLRALAEGSRCELEAYLEDELDEDESDEEEDFVGFVAAAWPHCLAFLQDSTAPLEPLKQAIAFTHHHYRPSFRFNEFRSQLRNIRSNAHELGFRALREAADAALLELEAMELPREVLV